MVGAFYQPEMVIIDPSALLTLPAREIGSGMAEVIKYGAIRSADFFGELCRLGELTGADGLAGSEEASRIIYECCRIKSGIVERDERDFGERALLNFGHTFGHAIEASAGFGRAADAYRHGEAVAFGMVIAASAGEAMGITAPGTADSLRRALALYGLCADYPGRASDLLPILATDKKSRKDGVQMVMLREIGGAFTKWLGFRELGAILERTEA
jgi:3-dehydroquinate synthase